MLNNIQVKQLGEIGIAGVSFEEYKYYYNNLNVEVEEGEKLNDEELEEYYYEQLELEYESKKERDKEEIGGEKKHPRAKKALKVTGIVVLAYGVTAGIVNLILYFY